MMKVLAVQHNPETDDYFIELPDDMLEAAGFKIGDTLVWEKGDDETWRLYKKERNDMPIYVVDTISVFRIRYAVRARNEEHAMDSVVCNEAEEVSQKFVDENIISAQQVTEEEYLAMFDKDNDYLKNWLPEQKLARIHVIDYNDDV